MTNKLILCAPLAMVLSSCSITQMGEVVPESRDTDFGKVAVHGFNTGSVISYGKNHKTGYMETSNVTVYHDSGIDNVTKLAHAAGSVAMGTGSVLQGVGVYKYGKAWEALSAGGDLDIRHHGMQGTEVNVENGNNVSVEGSSADANADAFARSKSESEASAGASADIRIKGGGDKHGGKHGGGHGGNSKKNYGGGGGYPQQRQW